VAIFFSQIRENAIVDAAFKGMRPVVVALMLAPILGFVRGMRWWAVAVACGVAIAIWHFGFSPIYLLVAGAVAGLMWAAARGKEVER
jgi:chromate transporter